MAQFFEKFADNLPMAAAVIGTAATGIGFAAVLLDKTQSIDFEAERRMQIEGHLIELKRQNKVLTEQLDAVKKSLSSLEIPPSEGVIALNMTNLQNDVATIKSSVSNIFLAVTDNPEKAMSIPLMRKDISQLETSMTLLSVEQEKNWTAYTTYSSGSYRHFWDSPLEH